MYKQVLVKNKQKYNLSFICNISLDKIGSILFSANTNNSGYISNLSVSEKFRKKNYGTILIKNAENILIEKHNINTIKLTAWENTYISGSLLGFFEKNGYCITDIKDISYYDNGYDIYNIIPMIKRYSIKDNLIHYMQ